MAHNRKQRQVKIDDKTKISYEWEEKGNGFLVTPPVWSNPFFTMDLKRADQILSNVYRVKQGAKSNA